MTFDGFSSHSNWIFCLDLQYLHLHDQKMTKYRLISPLFVVPRNLFRLISLSMHMLCRNITVINHHQWPINRKSFAKGKFAWFRLAKVEYLPWAMHINWGRERAPPYVSNKYIDLIESKYLLWTTTTTQHQHKFVWRANIPASKDIPVHIIIIIIVHRTCTVH